MWHRPKPDEYIARLLEVFTDPVIVYDESWGDTLPEWIKDRITIERIVRVYKGEDDYATDAEALAYLYCASLALPMSQEWANIYLYLAGRYMKKRGADAYEWVPKELSDHEQSKLRELKHWIRKEQKKVVKVRKRQAKEFKKEYEQMGLFKLGDGGGSESKA